MTTILLDFKGKKLYTDSRATSSQLSLSIKCLPKIEEVVEDGQIKFWSSKVFGRRYTGTGSLNILDNAVIAIEKGRKPKIKGNTNLWQIDSYPSLKLTTYHAKGSDITTDAYFVSNGSGGQYVAGALKASSDPKEAMEIAISLDKYSGGDVRVYDVSGAPEWGDIE